MLVWAESAALTEREKWACQQMARWVRLGEWGDDAAPAADPEGGDPPEATP